MLKRKGEESRAEVFMFLYPSAAHRIRSRSFGSEYVDGRLEKTSLV